MKMYVIDNGEIRFGTDNRVTLKGGSASIPIHVFLFETEKGYVLFDTGCDPDGMEKNWPERIKAAPYIQPCKDLLNSLKRLGIDAGDIKYVIMSHLHVDHAGGLKYFPNARIVVSNAEFKKTMHDYAIQNLDGFHLKSDIESWLKAELNWLFIDENTKTYTLAEGFTIYHFGPGHSYGMLGALVNLKETGNVILAGDTIYTRSHMGPPVQIAGIAYDEEGYIHTVEQIAALAEEKNASIFFGHDMEQFQSLKKSTEGYYS